MKYAKQRLELEAPIVLAHTDLNGTFQTHEFSVRCPVAGRLTDVEIEFQTASLNQSVAWFLQVLPEDFQNTASYNNDIDYLLDAMLVSDSLVVSYFQYPAFVGRGSAITINYREKMYHGGNVNAGEVLNIRIYTKGTADPTAGQINFDVKGTVEVYALNRYSSDLPLDQQRYANVVIACTTDVNDNIPISFPADGVLGNIHGLQFSGTMDSEELVYLGYNPEIVVPTTDTAQLSAEKRGFVLRGTQDAEGNYDMISSYSFDRIRVRRGQPLYLINKVDGEIGYVITASYHMYDKNKFKYGREIRFDSTNPIIQYIEVPFDCYAYGVEIDYVLANESYAKVDFHLFHPPIDITSIDGLATGSSLQEVGFGLETELYELRSPSIIDTMLFSGHETAAAAFVGTGQVTAPILDFIPAGTLLLFHSRITLTGSINLNVSLYAHAEMASAKYLGKHLLIGEEVLSQINGGVTTV